MGIKDMNEEYGKLIENAKSYYKSGVPELKNIKNGKKLFSLEWCDGLEDEINLWTYWQGAGNKSPQIMVVGQDFGTCYEDKDKEFYHYLCSAKEDNTNKSQRYIERIISNPKNRTDNNLFELTKQLGDGFSADIPGNSKLFFTNMCLGYRTGESISGGNVSYFLRHDSLYIKELISIKKPQVVICLGADTYFSLLSCLNVDKSILEGVNTCFWTELEQGNNYQSIDIGSLRFRVYGVSHAGSNGLINRKRLTGHLNDKLLGIDLMRQDWRRIGEYLE